MTTEQQDGAVTPAPGPVSAADIVRLTPCQCRTARMSLGWTQEGLAAAAGLCWRTIVDFENARVTPRAGTLIAIRKALRLAGAFDHALQD